VQEWYVGATGEVAQAGWHEWPGQVDVDRYGVEGSVSHFQAWSSELIFEDGMQHPLEDWQLDFARDLFRLTLRDYGMGPAFEELWLVVPEGNSKSTFIAEIALYHLETVLYPWVPIAASSRDQAEILFGQANGFIERTPGLKWEKDLNAHGPYKVKGTRQIDHTFSGGHGMKVYAADKETADGVIPTLPIIDEGHRMRDLGLYRLWKGKLEKRHGRIVMISTAGEPGKDFEKTRRALKTTAAKVDRRGRCFGRYESDAAVLHDYSLPSTALVGDLEAVKEANPRRSRSPRCNVNVRRRPWITARAGCA
jgi:phage terminase large subunit-like protein